MRKAWELIQQTMLNHSQPHIPFDPANRAMREALIAAVFERYSVWIAVADMLALSMNI